MGKRKIPLILLTVFMLVLLSVPLSAGNKWYTCSVVRAGAVGSDSVVIKLTINSTLRNLSCQARAGQEDRMLAIALVAKINDRKVIAYFDPYLNASDRIIYNLYIK